MSEVPFIDKPVSIVAELLDLSKKELGSRRKILNSPECHAFLKEHATPDELRLLKKLYFAVEFGRAAMILAGAGSGMGALAIVANYEIADKLFKKVMGEKGIAPYAGPWGTIATEQRENTSGLGPTDQAIRNMQLKQLGPWSPVT